MGNLILRLVLALIITVAAAIYQRFTGPTHPVDGGLNWENTGINYHLLRSHNGEGDQQVAVTVADTSIDGYLIFRRFKANEGWTGMQMMREGPELKASIPHQPPAGKIEYFILLNKKGQSVTVPQDYSVITRFTGFVPAYVLIPHILVMFAAMFFSNLAGFEAIARADKAYTFTLWAAGLLFLGGMILGPIVQKFAFDAFWTGIPWGMDLTDNKTLIGMIAWIIAAYRGRKNRKARGWIIAAAVILIGVYLIPHSMMGSELDYQTMEIGTGE